MVSPGTNPMHPLVMKAKMLNIPIKIDIDLLYEYRRKKDLFIGVTGSNGKTTVVEMISHLLPLPHLLCGNIGVSVLKKCPTYKGYRIYIMEISSFQLHYLHSMKFYIGLINNIHPNHDEWHGGFENYKKDKMKLIDFSINKKNYEGDGKWISKGSIIYRNHIPFLTIYNKCLQTPHNSKNLCGALDLLEDIFSFFHLSFSSHSFIEKINSFALSPLRQEIIYQYKNLSIINDSKSTSIHSTIAAIKAFIGQKILLMMGGEIKGDLKDLKELLSLIDRIIIFGSSSSLIENFLQENKFLYYEKCEKLSYWVPNTTYEGVILFSPGGASFDEFKNYKHRGNFFNEKYKKLLPILTQ